MLEIILAVELSAFNVRKKITFSLTKKSTYLKVSIYFNYLEA